MKTPDEIKKSLRIHTLNHRSGCIGCAYRGDNPAKIPNSCADKLFKDVREYIQQLESRVPRWISVKERLPEKGNVVLVMWHGEIELARYTPHRLGWYNFASQYDSPNAVTHWMPLPEPPKEE